MVAAERGSCGLFEGGGCVCGRVGSGRVQGECRGHAHPELLQLATLQWSTAVHDVLQGRAVDEFRHQVRLLGVGVGVQHLGSAEPGHPQRAFGLTPEPGAELRVPRVLVADDLDRYVPSVGCAPDIDDAHPALAEKAEQLVRADAARVACAQRT
jgi:hypothetical protein